MKKYLVPLVVLLALVPAFIPERGTAQVSSPYARRIWRFASAPAACSEGDVYYNTATDKLNICTATNTWAAVTALDNTTTGTGSIVRATSPTLVTPTLGAASATTLTTTGGGVDLQIGGTTSSFPAWKRVSAAVRARRADDSADAEFISSGAYIGGSLNLTGLSLVRWTNSSSNPWDSFTIDTAIQRLSAGLLEVNNGTGGQQRDVRLRGVQYSTGTRPTCNESNRGFVWYVAGGAGVADTFEVCRKDAADAYAWATLF